MTTGLAEALRTSLAGEVAADRPLGALTTYRLGGTAAVYAEVTGLSDLEQVARHLALAADRIPVLVLGRGSNVVISDEGFPGLALRLGEDFGSIRAAGESGLSAGGATSLPLLANWSARRGLTGLEFVIAIPGSVGGAVRMNAGAHGREIRDSLSVALVFDLQSGELIERDASGLEMSYRHSGVGERHVVIDATFRLQRADPESVRARTDDYRRHRAATQPGALQNAGSVFKNPPGDHAGRLVDAAGLKGFRVGGARVSEIHANFFIAEDGSSAQDVYDLVHEVKTRVFERFGVDLTPEIRFVGSFQDRVTTR